MKVVFVSTVLATMLVAAPAYSQQPAEPPSDVPPNAAQTADTTPAVDPSASIRPEVMAVVNRGKRYTTKDLVNAQLHAMLFTPTATPTTTVTTTVTTPGEPG